MDGIFLHGVCKPVNLYVNGRRSIWEAIYFATNVFLPLIKLNFDVVDCQEFPYFPGFSVKSASQIKQFHFIITWYEVWYDYWHHYLGKISGYIGKIIELLTSKLPDRIIAISNMVKNDLISIAGIPPNLIKVIPDGIDFKKIQRVPPAKVGFDILYAGRLVKHKNVDLLIASLEIIKSERPDVTCGIIGDGPERRNLEKLVMELNLEKNITFLGFLERDTDVFSYMKSSGIFVLPSTREGAGLVTLEANACGLPVVVVRHEKNAATEVVIEGENGFISHFSKESLAEKILTALDNKNNMKERCINFSRKYDWDKIADLTESVYWRM